MHIVPTTSRRLRDLRTGALLVMDDPAIFRIEGSGAVSCLQGLLTTDVEKPGDGHVLYGALLSPKGMIAVDFQVLRNGGAFLLLADPAGRDAAVEIFRRLLPPRLARVTDLTGQWRALFLLGPGADRPAAALGADPEAGRCLTLEGPVWLARAGPAAACRYLAAGPGAVLEPLAARLVEQGVTTGTRDDLFAARVLAGVPTLGHEIGEKTLPQEVRFDELGGVSYTKGCYVGQETVARVHFRGHPNRLLRGVVLPPGSPHGSAALAQGGKAVGQLTTVLAQDGAPSLGLASVRREIEIGAELGVGDATARIVALPFAGAG